MRAGPTFEEFERSEFPELKRTLAPFAGGSLPVEVSEKIDDEFGLVASQPGRSRVRCRHCASKARCGASSSRAPCASTSSGPPPDSRGEFVKQIGVEKHGAGGAGIAVLYLDGVTLDAQTFSDADSATIFANFETRSAGPAHGGGVHERCRRGRRAGVDLRP